MNMNFFDQMKKTAVNDINYNMSITENGAIGYKTTSKDLLDMNFKVASYRHYSEREIIKDFTKAWFENKRLALLWLFYVRDIREGLGERRLFRVCLKALMQDIDKAIMKETVKELLKLVSEYGRYDDLYSVLGVNKTVDSIVAEIFKEQLDADLTNMEEGKSVSLLAKWLKTESASNPESRRLAKWTMKAVDMPARMYRRTLSALRKYIDVTEVKMTANEWSKIDYSKVPSRASLLYKNAFKRHDAERYSKFIEKVNKGEEKINAGVLYPHDIVSKYMSNSGWSSTLKKNLDETLEALWKNLPNTVKGDETTLVVADGSGSMMDLIGQTSVAALDVANALAIYFAEKAKGPYKDKYITFSSHPQFVDFSQATTLRDKLKIALEHDDCSNTNIEAVFDLILDTAKINGLKQEDIPVNILVISDMEFNHCAESNSNYYCTEALFKKIAERYEKAGYKLPRLVFWNVNSRTETLPIIQNDLGVALVSGFSVNIAKMVLSGELDPYKCLVKELESERYAPVANVIKEIV